MMSALCAGCARRSNDERQALENQTKRSVSLRPPMHPRLCCTRNSSGSAALPTQNARESAMEPLLQASSHSSEGRQDVYQTHIAPHAPHGAPGLSFSQKKYFSSCAQLHRARQCSVAHVRILQYTNRFRFCIARRDLHAAHCQPNIPVGRGAASTAWRAARRRAGRL